MEAVNEGLELATLARDASDQLKSSELWRDIFGDSFPLFDVDESEETRAKSAEVALGGYSHAKPLPWPEQLGKRYKVRLDAYLYSGGNRLGGINSNGRTIASGLRIKYAARTRSRGDYEVYWQVVNTGRHAEKENGLRGDFFKARLPDGNPSPDPLVIGNTASIQANTG